MPEDKNLHGQHRARLKTHFLRDGLDGFEDHNVLELLLFYAIPQADTNPLAHRLMERYGSLAAVFDAPKEDLMRVEGIGEHTATLIKLIPALARRYCKDRFGREKTLPDYKTMGNYLVSYFLGRNTESVYALYYSASLVLLEEVELFSGSINCAAFSVRDVAEKALLNKASYVVLAHNHPGGVAIASVADLDVTRTLRSFLSQMSVMLLDHFVIAESRYFSFQPEDYEDAYKRILQQQTPIAGK